MTSSPAETEACHRLALQRGLLHLRASQRLCDLRLMCHGGQDVDGAVRPVLAHVDILAARSQLLRSLLSSAGREPGVPICLTLPDASPETAELLLGCLYSGESAVRDREQLDEVKGLAETLGLEIDLEKEALSAPLVISPGPDDKGEEAKEDCAEEPEGSSSKFKTPAMRKEFFVPPILAAKKNFGVRPGPKSKERARSAEETKREKKDQSGSLAPERVVAPSPSPSPAPVPKSSSLAPNPLFGGGGAASKGGPQKRRRTPDAEGEQHEEQGGKGGKKESRADVKKMRPDESSSEVDSEALDERRKEIPTTARKAPVVTSDSEEEEGGRDSKKKSKRRSSHDHTKKDDGHAEERPKPRKNPFSKSAKQQRSSADKENLPSGDDAKEKEAKKSEEVIVKRKIEEKEDEEPSTKKTPGSNAAEGSKEAKIDSPKVKKSFAGGRRPGPKSKTQRRKDSAAAPQQEKPPSKSTKSSSPPPGTKTSSETNPPEGLFTTDDVSVNICKKCDAFLLSKDALKIHMDTKHGDKKDIAPPKETTAKHPVQDKEINDAAKKEKGEESDSSAKKSAPAVVATSETSESELEERWPKKFQEDPMVKKNKKATRKEKRQRLFSSSSESEKECESPAPERKKKVFVRLKDKSAEGLLTQSPKTPKSSSSHAATAAKSSERRSSVSFSSGVSAGFFKCNFCDGVFDKQSNLKNHVVNHFKDQLLRNLPPMKPFSCPECDAPPSRDKITLLRHYAFTHKKIFEFCKVSALVSPFNFVDIGFFFHFPQESDLSGTKASEEEVKRFIASGGGGGKSEQHTPKAKSEQPAPKSKKVESFSSKAVLSSSDSSSSDDEEGKKRRRSENAA